jgi:hypothetical protein
MEGFMRSIDLESHLGAAIVLGLALPIAAVFALAIAIQGGVVEPPNVDWQLGRVHIMAYRTSTPECPPYFCDPKSVEPTQAYYVVWSINELISNDQPYRRYRNMARRLFVVPLKG